MKKLFTLITICFFISTAAWASRILIPMDAHSQANHLKAYGIAYAVMQQGIKVDWLLNYKGGSFGMDYDKDMQDLCKQRGVSYIKMSNKQYDAIVKQVSDPSFNGQVVKLEKAPKIAVYTPSNKKPWDDAVTLALTYAEIPFDKIYVNEVLAGDLSKYDWVHLFHEDFTGQYGKFWAQFGNADWYKTDKAAMEALAAQHGFKKVSQMQLAVVKKIKDFIADGGNMFAMCSATQTFDIALAAEGVDICDAVFDGDAPEQNAQNKLDYSKCLAFKDFKVTLDPYQYTLSDIDNTTFRILPGQQTAWDEQATQPNTKYDIFKLYNAPAKFDQVAAMLTQNHTSTINGFMGQTTAFRKQVLKPGVEVLGDFPACNEARYIHGDYGKGSWTFLGGHDPEAYRHMVNDAPTDLSQYPNSPGYRLILNNVLFPAAPKTAVPTVTINTAATVPADTDNVAQRPGGVNNLVQDNGIKIYPNPANDELVITLSSGNIEQVSVQNFAGQEVISHSYHAGKVSVSLASLPAGMYMIKVNGEFAGKVVKE